MLTTLKTQTARASEAAVKVADEALIRHIESQIDDLDTQIAQALEGERFREKGKLCPPPTSSFDESDLRVSG